MRVAAGLRRRGRCSEDSNDQFTGALWVERLI